MNEKFKDLMEQFVKMCGGRFACEGCPYEHYSHDDECRAAFVYDQLVGPRHDSVGSKPTGQPRQNGADTLPKPATACKMKAAQMPKWCKAGAWVLMNNTLYKIAAVNGDPYYPLTVKNTHGECAFAHPRVTYPVRFRPYRYEEAEKLIGKVMKLETDAFRRLEMITEVHGDKAGGIAINCKTLEDLTNEYNATIDGTPIGVPEVDEKALEEVEE